MAVPLTSRRSSWIPPPSDTREDELETPRSISSRELDVSVRLPLMKRVPAVPEPPGLIVPALVSVLTPPPKSIVPVPEIIPSLVKPFTVENVEPLARLRVPAWLKNGV